MRIGEPLSIEVDDLDLTRDDEHITIPGQRRTRRTVPLDDPSVVAMLRRYLAGHAATGRGENRTRIRRQRAFAQLTALLGDVHGRSARPASSRTTRD
jgi:integrase